MPLPIFFRRALLCGFVLASFTGVAFAQTQSFDEMIEDAGYRFVKEGGGQEAHPRIPDLLGIIRSFQMIQHELHEMNYTQTMAETTVLGARICVVTDPQLMDSAQTLNFWATQQVD